jgi:hypothetical protein
VLLEYRRSPPGEAIAQRVSHRARGSKSLLTRTRAENRIWQLGRYGSPDMSLRIGVAGVVEVRWCCRGRVQEGNRGENEINESVTGDSSGPPLPLSSARHHRSPRFGAREPQYACSTAGRPFYAALHLLKCFGGRGAEAGLKTTLQLSSCIAYRVREPAARARRREACPNAF